MIDRGLFDAYAAALAANADLAQSAIRALAPELQGMTQQRVTAYLKGIYPAIVAEYGAYAASCAVEFYAELRAAAGLQDEYAPAMREPHDGKILVDDVMKISEKSADSESLLKSLSNKGVEQVMKRADETIWQNARDDPARPKWALVPRAGACGWCVMIGSRGFDYASRQSVSNMRHSSCRCTPVVDFDTSNPKLDGYDPGGMRNRYRQCEDTIRDSAEVEWNSMSEDDRAKYKKKGQSAHSVFMRNKTIAEMDTRDRGWLNTGKPCKVAFDSEWDQFERITALQFGLQGFNVNPVDRSLIFRDRKPDMLLNGIDAEMKHPEKSHYMAIWNQFKKAVYGSSNIRNPQSERLVIGTCRNNASLDTVLGHAKAVAGDEKDAFPEIKEVIIVGEDGMRRLRR